jgi:ABC-type dipeptide/oligopeptide/nickel transport system ATPase component
MALLRNAKLIVADEPTSSLDVTLQMQVMDVFRQLQANGMTFLFISHHLPLAATFCQRVAILHQGEVVEVGDPKILFKNPSHAYTRKLINAIPKIL